LSCSLQERKRKRTKDDEEQLKTKVQKKTNTSYGSSTHLISSTQNDIVLKRNKSLHILVFQPRKEESSITKAASMENVWQYLDGEDTEVE
jgi:hypothetical protein